MPKIELNDPRRCPECNGFEHHDTDCSFISVEQLRELVNHHRNENIFMQKQRDGYYQTWNRLRDEATLWKGKFLIVKHENNKLRAKIKSEDKPDMVLETPKSILNVKFVGGNLMEDTVSKKSLADFLDDNLQKSKEQPSKDQKFQMGWLAALMHVKKNFLEK